MSPLLFIVLLVGVAWLTVRLHETRLELAALRRLLDRLQRKVEEIGEQTRERKVADQAVPSTGTGIATLAPTAPAHAPASQPPIIATAVTPPPLPTGPAQPVFASQAGFELGPAAPPLGGRPAFAKPPPPIDLASASGPAPGPTPAPPPTEPFVNWERFMGAKLFAWLGGFALFLGVAFFVKYSFEHNLIPAWVRVVLGFIAGVALVVGGVVMKRREYAVTAQTLCATGVLILYAVSFACHSYYHFTGIQVTFALMAAITCAAFLLAVQMEARVVAVLGLVGGFVTPILLSSGQDQALALFSYVALLDIGLIAVALHRRWHFLILLGAIGTLAMQIGWTATFFSPAKIFVAMPIFLGFDLLFFLAFWIGDKLGQRNHPGAIAALGLPSATLLFVGFLLSYRALGERVGVLASFMFGADLCLLAVPLLRSNLRLAPVLAGGAVFMLLSAWTAQYLTADLLSWALAVYFVFAILHSAFPILLQRWRPGVSSMWWTHLFPPLALGLVLFPLLRQSEASWLIWIFVLLIDAVAIGLAVLTASVLAISAVLLLTLLVTAIWIFKVPVEITSLPPLLFVILGFSVFFYALSIVAEALIRKKWVQGGDAGKATAGSSEGEAGALLLQVPAMAAVLPFVLLIMVTARLPVVSPSAIFGVGLVLVVLLLGVAVAARLDAVLAVALGCVLGLEFAWHSEHFRAATPWIPLLWYLVFYAIFTLFPLVFRRWIQWRSMPWAIAALAGPLHFFLIHRAVVAATGDVWIGLLPAAMAVPMLAGLAWLNKNVAGACPNRLAVLAWFGASALFFITLIFPIQFRKEWLTIGWALEGAALLWLFHKVPHPGLRLAGFGLLCVAFARLAINPAVLDYYQRSGRPLFNWFLYSYGLVTVALLAGARLLAPPRERWRNINLSGALYGLGTVLSFLLVNIEIADYFGTGARLTFDFSGNFARDMSYSIAWALFALMLLVIGFRQRVPAVRYAALGLLSVTLLKLFLHDLSQLAQLYRIGAFVAVAVILILASFLYQRFFSRETMSARRATTAKPDADATASRSVE